MIVGVIHYILILASIARIPLLGYPTIFCLHMHFYQMSPPLIHLTFHNTRQLVTFLAHCNILNTILQHVSKGPKSKCSLRNIITVQMSATANIDISNCDVDVIHFTTPSQYSNRKNKDKRCT